MRLSDLLLREVSDPRLTGVSVTTVEMTPDLSRASISWRGLPGGPADDDVAAGLGSAASFLRRELARSLGLRRAPELVFAKDDLIEVGGRIDELLEETTPEDEGDDDGSEES